MISNEPGYNELIMYGGAPNLFNPWRVHMPWLQQECIRPLSVEVDTAEVNGTNIVNRAILSKL